LDIPKKDAICFFGKPKPITGDAFKDLKENWESGTGNRF
jgi:hypothetical protein